jgi:hypothetical protein
MKRNQNRKGWTTAVSVVSIVVLAAIMLSRFSIRKMEVLISDEGEYRQTYRHEGKPMAVWTDLDIEYRGAVDARYRLTFTGEDGTVTELVCDPFEVGEKLDPREVEIDGLTKVSYLAPMGCVLDLPQGRYDVVVNFSVSGEEYQLFWADIFLQVRDE